jgi:hypothetical protein
MEVLRQLPEQRTELRRFDERPDAFVEALEAGTHIGESPHVGEEATRLDGEQEAGRSLLHPAFHRRAWR